MKLIRILEAALPAAILLAGCAKTSSTDYGALSVASFDAWVSIHREPSWQETPLGSWIVTMDDDASKESTLTEDDYPYIRLSCSVSDLEGNISYTTDRTLSRQLGSSFYQKYYWYGPRMTYRGSSSMYAGLSEIIDGMHLGGHCKVVIPGWLLTTSRHGDKQGYLDAMSESTSAAIYDFTIEELISDVQAWEKTVVKEAVSKYAQADSLGDGLYYVQLTAPDDTSEFSSGDEVYINYICRRLFDYQGVDTDIADSAKVFGTWNSSKTYSPTLINWADNADGLTMTSSSSSIIDGFASGIFQMKSHEKGRVFMTSSFAYGSSGSGNAIPSYCPLVFDITMTDDPDED